MAKYIVLTNKEEYQTDLSSPGLEILETYEYYFFDQLRAKYTIALVKDDSIKIKLIEQKGDKIYTNEIPVKFFEGYEKIEDAQEELQELTGPGSDDSKLLLVV